MRFPIAIPTAVTNNVCTAIAINTVAIGNPDAPSGNPIASSSVEMARPATNKLRKEPNERPSAPASPKVASWIARSPTPISMIPPITTAAVSNRRPTIRAKTIPKIGMIASKVAKVKAGRHGLRPRRPRAIAIANVSRASGRTKATIFNVTRTCHPSGYGKCLLLTLSGLFVLGAEILHGLAQHLDFLV